MRPSRRCDWPSVAKRGSRLTGLASMRKVREEGLNFVGRPQEARANGSREAMEKKSAPSWLRKLAGRGIGDFTKDGWPARAGGGGDVGGTLVPSFVGEDGEGQGFFGVGGDVEI